jgi:hypothetical protein
MLTLLAPDHPLSSGVPRGIEVFNAVPAYRYIINSRPVAYRHYPHALFLRSDGIHAYEVEDEQQGLLTGRYLRYGWDDVQALRLDDSASSPPARVAAGAVHEGPPLGTGEGRGLEWHYVLCIAVESRPNGKKRTLRRVTRGTIQRDAYLVDPHQVRNFAETIAHLRASLGRRGKPARFEFTTLGIGAHQPQWSGEALPPPQRGSGASAGRSAERLGL